MYLSQGVFKKVIGVLKGLAVERKKERKRKRERERERESVCVREKPIHLAHFGAPQKHSCLPMLAIRSY